MPIPFYLAAFFFGAATFALGLAAFFFGVGWAASAASFHFASFVAALRLRMACACESCAMMLVLCGEGRVNHRITRRAIQERTKQDALRGIHT